MIKTTFLPLGIVRIGERRQCSRFFPLGRLRYKKETGGREGQTSYLWAKQKRRVEIIIYKQNSSLNFLLGSMKRIMIFSINRFTSWFKKLVWLNHAVQLNSETAGLHKEHDKSIFLVTSPPFEALLAQFYKARVRKIAPEWRGNATCTQEAASASFIDVPKMSVAEDGSSRQVKKNLQRRSFTISLTWSLIVTPFWLVSMLWAW